MPESLNYSDPFGLSKCKVQSICDALDSANKWASALMGRDVQTQVKVPSGTRVPLPNKMSLHIPVQSTLTLSRTGDGSNITAGFRGYAFVDVAPNRWYVPTLQIREAGVNLGTGDIGLKGDVILPVEVKGNLREGIIDVSVGGYKKRIELEPDKK